MAIFTVTTNADSGVGSLRQALADAQTNGVGADTINFDATMAGQKINLTSGALAITSGAVTINGDTDGDGDADITVERGPSSMFNSHVLTAASGTTVTLGSLVIRNANTNASEIGGINNAGTMMITDSLIAGLTARTSDVRSTAGIVNSGTLTVRETVLDSMYAAGGTGNSSGDYKYDGWSGGNSVAGIRNSGGAQLLLQNVLFSNITARGGNGGDGYMPNAYAGSRSGNGGYANAGWLGGTVTGNAGVINVTATGGAAGLATNPGLRGSNGSSFVPATSGGFTLSNMTSTTLGDDIISGDGLANTIYGLTGDDTLSGDAGVDVLFGGSGSDTLNGGADADILNGWTGHDTLNGDAGDDQLNGQAGNDIMNGGTGLDRLSGATGNDTMNGGGDADWLHGADGADIMSGDAGADTLLGANGNDTLNGGTGADSLNGQGNDDTLNGGADNDSLAGGDGNDILNGDAGIDKLFGQDGNDTMNGGSEADTLIGGAGTDTLRGDAGADILSGETGADDLEGGTGNDRLTGGTDADIFRFMANGFQRDSITDFAAGVDTLVIDVSVFQDTHASVTTVQQVIDTFGSMNAAGSIYTLNFGSGDVIDIKVTAGFGALTLVDDINLIS